MNQKRFEKMLDEFIRDINSSFIQQSMDLYEKFASGEVSYESLYVILQQAVFDHHRTFVLEFKDEIESEMKANEEAKKTGLN